MAKKAVKTAGAPRVKKVSKRSWAQEEIAVLKKMVQGNVIGHEIALSLGRTLAATYRKASSLGLSMFKAHKRRRKLAKAK